MELNKKTNHKWKSNLQHLFRGFRLPSRISFIVLGIASTIWFLIRVIPKPQRAGYPCMRTAAPIMSGFILYLLSIGGITLLFKNFVSNIKKAKYIAASVAFVSCLVLLVAFNIKDVEKVYSQTLGIKRGELPDGPNNPMGVGRGIYPGRVVWTWNPEATNKSCPNTIDNAYFMPENNNQDTINKMADQSILSLSGASTVSEAWDAIFKNFNTRKLGTVVGYTEGQTIFIKINNGQAGWAINMSDMSETGNRSSTGVQDAAMSNTTPATVVAIIRQLVDDCGIPQNKIYVSEPMTHVYKSVYDAVHNEFPNVIILDKENHTNLGRTTSSGWTEDAIVYSDKGDEMPDAITDALMNEMYNADYMINVAALKAHARNGVTLGAKLHFGSHGDHPGFGYGSFHLHKGLIATVDNDVMTSGVRGDYGMYRVLVDLMGHKKLGENTVLFIVDGLWGGIEATDMPVKWKTAPFNNDFPSSLFMSLDDVALESVCIDFLRAEADINASFKDRPFFPAVDDYLHQAADPANWPSGITYDPEDDGISIGSLGVHEHWNNATYKQYTRNLSADGLGIELVSIPEYKPVVGVKNQIAIDNFQVYPNPCNSETNVSFQLNETAKVEISILSIDGKTVKTITEKQMMAGNYNSKLDISTLKSGIYLCTINISTKTASEMRTLKIEKN